MCDNRHIENSSGTSQTHNVPTEKSITLTLLNIHYLKIRKTCQQRYVTMSQLYTQNKKIATLSQTHGMRSDHKNIPLDQYDFYQLVLGTRSHISSDYTQLYHK